MEYKLIILGGTFDRLHEGHQAFLRYAFSHGERVRIGITSDAYVALYKKDHTILPFSDRKKEVENFLREENVFHRADIVAIDDKFAQTQHADIQGTALLVSTETYKAGIEVNNERIQNGLQPLPVLVMPLVVSQTGEKISSSAIRSGLFDTKGDLVFTKLTQPILLSEDLRDVLHQPFGTLCMGSQLILPSKEAIVSVGDVTTKRLHDMGISPNLSVIDFRVERHEQHKTLQELGFTGSEVVRTLTNPPGKIMPEVWTVLADITRHIATEKRHFAVIVEGEEDLLVIPLVLLLPVGFTILYGQPGQGVVLVDVTQESKQQLTQLLRNYL